MERRSWFIADIMVLCGMLAPAANVRAGLVVDDSLQGSTIGTRSGGAFVADGWKVLNSLNYIYWHIVPTITHGAYEFDVKGIGEDCIDGSKNELSHMYDWTYQNADTNYTGYRNNPFKHFVRKQCRTDRVEELEILWLISPNGYEDDAAPNLVWDPNHTYHFRVEWVPNGQGGTDAKTFRDGQQLHSRTIPGLWNPTGHSFKIASSLRSEEGAYPGAIYSNVKVYNLAVWAPIIAEVTPDPDTAFVGVEYVEQLILLQGAPPPSWTVVTGKPGMTVDNNGLVRGWIPQVSDAGSLHTLRVRAENSQGSDLEVWQVYVRFIGDFDDDLDVDQEDFGFFQACLSGSGEAYADGCEDADLDTDGDVDLADFEDFQACVGGANQSPACS